MVKSIAAAVHSVDPEIALARPRSMEEVRELVLSNDRFTLVLFVSFAAVALLLLFAAVIACLVPARRAASVEPIQALRAE